MRHGRLLLTEQDGKVFVGVDSLLRALREVPRLRDVADEVEIAVLRAQVSRAQGQLVRGDIQRKLDHEVGGRVVTIDGQDYDWEYRDTPPMCAENRHDSRGDCDGPLYRAVLRSQILDLPLGRPVTLCESHLRQAQEAGEVYTSPAGIAA